MGVMPYERNDYGIISIENLPIDENKDVIRAMKGTLGIKIAKDGRIWICIEGVSFIRFKPLAKEDSDEKENSGSPPHQNGEDHPHEKG